MSDVGPFDPRALEAALLPTPECATIEQLGRLCDEDDAGSDDARAAAHVAGCLRCRTELALLKQFDCSAIRRGEAQDVSWIVARLERDMSRLASGHPLIARREVRGARRPAWLRATFVRTIAGGLAAAAAALLVILNVPGRDAPPRLSTEVTARPEILRSDALAVKAPEGDLEAPPAELRWEAAKGAASYSVEVTEVDHTQVWSGQSREPRVALPGPVRTRVVPGKPFLWKVVAKDAAGNTIAVSEVHRFRVRMRTRDSRE